MASLSGNYIVFHSVHMTTNIDVQYHLHVHCVPDSTTSILIQRSEGCIGVTLGLVMCLLCMYTMAIKGKGPPNPNPTWLNQQIYL